MIITYKNQFVSGTLPNTYFKLKNPYFYNISIYPIPCLTILTIYWPYFSQLKPPIMNECDKILFNKVKPRICVTLVYRPICYGPCLGHMNGKCVCIKLILIMYMLYGCFYFCIWLMTQVIIYDCDIWMIITMWNW